MVSLSVPRPSRGARTLIRAAALAALFVVVGVACLRLACVGQVFTAMIASPQLAGAVTLWLRERRPALRRGWPVMGAAVALATCLAAPQATPVVGALARLAVYASLLRLFAHSLRAGREPVVTRFARHIHPAMTQDRIAYTRGVTWLWTGFFATQLALWFLLLVTAPYVAKPWFVAWADVPLLAALLAGELGVRAIKFRGQPHGSLRDMWRAGRGA